METPKPPRPPNPRVEITPVLLALTGAALGGLLTSIGSLLPWYQVVLIGAVGGLQTDGEVTVIAGIAILALAGYASWSIAARRTDQPNKLSIAVLFVSACALGITLGRILGSYGSGVLGPIESPFGGGGIAAARLGAGIFITLVGSALAMAGSGFALERIRRDRGGNPRVTAAFLTGAAVLAVGLTLGWMTYLTAQG